MEDKLFLGIVLYAHPSDNAGYSEFCRLRPTHRQEDGSWIALLNASVDFPDEGLVFWWQPAQAAPKGSGWIFKVSPQPFYDGARKKDRYQVADSFLPQRALELLTIPGATDKGKLRKILAVGSFPSSPVPIGLPLFSIPEDESGHIAVGPMEYTLSGSDGDRQREIQIRADSGFVRTHQADPALFQGIFAGGQSHKMLRPNAILGKPNGLFCVQSDEDLLHSLLTRIRKWSNSSADALGITKRLLDAYIVTFRDQELLADDFAREKSRAEAAENLVGQMLKSRKGLELLIDTLYANPKIAENISARVEADIAVKKQKEEHRLDAEFAEKKILLADLEKRLAEARTAFEAIEDRLQEKLANEKKLDERSKHAAAKLFSQHMMDAENQIITTLLQNSIVKTLSRRIDRVESENRFSPAVQSLAIPPVADIVAFRKLIGNAAIAFNLDPRNLGIAVALAAGKGNLLAYGDSASQLARVTALLLGGQRARAVFVSPTMFSISDLMSSAVSPVIERNGQPESLGDFLEGQSSESSVSAIVLEGVNRAPFESLMRDIVVASNPEAHEIGIPYRKANGSPGFVYIGGRTVFVSTLVHGDTAFLIPKEYAASVPLHCAVSGQFYPALSNDDAASFPGLASSAWSSLRTPLSESTIGSLRNLGSRPPFASSEFLELFAMRVAAVIGDIDQAVAETLVAFSCGRVSDNELDTILASLSGTTHRIFNDRARSSNITMAAKFFAKES